MSKRARTPRGRRGSKMPSIDDLPNPVAVKMIEDAVQAAVDEPAPPGFELLRDQLRDVLPMALLATAATLSPGTGSISINDAPKIPIRKVDIQTAFLHLMAKTSARMMSSAMARTPMRLFDADARAAALRSAPPAPPARQEVEASNAGSDEEATAGVDHAVKKPHR